MEFWLVLWLPLSLLVGGVAFVRGRSLLGWCLFSLLLSPLLGLVAVLILPSPDSEGDRPHWLTHTRCPACAERVRREAIRCKHCGHLLL